MPLREIPEPEGPLAERLTANGKRRLQLNKSEREMYKQSLLIDRLVLMMLSLEEEMTYEEMAEELDITVAQLKNLTRTEEFQDRWNQHFMQLGQDPRVELTQSRITELLPAAFLQMKDGLVNEDTPWTVKWKIIEKIFELSGIARPQQIHNDRKEIQEFLSQKSESDDSIQITIPGKYIEAVNKYRQADVVEGKYTNQDQDPE